MAKTCPACGYRPIGPFTDNCPICGESVRYASSDRRGGGGGGAPSGMMSPLARWLIGGSLALLFSFAGCCGLGAWRGNRMAQDWQEEAERLKAEAEAERKTRTVTVTAEQLLREFQTDPDAANQRYTRKYLEVSGVVERTGTDRDGMPFAVLHAGDEAAKLRIECFFDLDDPDETEFKRLTKGQPVTLRGEYAGRVTNIQLRDCALAK